MAMMAVAGRYARALADIVGRTGNYREILGELETFAGTYRESAELREVFQTPAVPVGEKIKVLDAILVRLATSPVTSNFLRVLLVHYRMNLLDEVVQAFRKAANARMGIVEVKVFSAAELSEAAQSALRARFTELTRRQVELKFHLDPALLGGILAQMNSTVYDGTVRGQLDRIREELLAR